MGNIGHFCCAGQLINGIIYNCSHFPIYYKVYDVFTQEGTIKNEWHVNATAKVSADGVDFQGGMYKQSSDLAKVYSKSSVLVQPGRFSSSGLEDMTAKKQKISICVLIKDQYVEIVTDSIVKTYKDICLKIRRDLSVKHYKTQRAQQIKNLRKDKPSKVEQEGHLKGRLPILKAMKSNEIANVQKILDGVPLSAEKTRQIIDYVKQHNEAWLKNNPPTTDKGDSD